MRKALWPDDHAREVDRYFEGEIPDMGVLVVDRPDGSGLCGFAESGLRKYAEGCDSSPSGYLEGIWVDDDVRRHGVGRQLVEAVRAWCRERGCSEMGSDCALDNEVSRRFHLALGMEEVLRAIHFRETL